MSVTSLEPKLPSHLRKTYAVHHAKRHGVGCHEVIDGRPVCPAFFNGWYTDCNPTDSAGAAQIHYLDSGDSGRHFTKEWMPDGFWRYTFTPGQRCFAAPHTVVDRQEEPKYLLLAGDARHYIGQPNPHDPGYATPVLVHSSADAWVDDFASHQERLAAAAE